MIDVHMILLGDENTEWLAQMIQSLANEPIALHIVRGEFGHIGKWRAEGFSRGSNPYVCYVDPDDYVLPGAFGACMAALDADPSLDAAWADDLLDVDGDLRPFANPLHHLCVYRRAFVDRLLGEVRGERLVPERVLEPRARAAAVGMPGYVYRNRPDSPAKRLLAQFNNTQKGVFTPFEGTS